jgi:hypothetical protein
MSFRPSGQRPLTVEQALWHLPQMISPMLLYSPSLKILLTHICLSQITAIEEKLTEYRAQVASIANLHSHSLSITDDAALQQDTAQLEAAQRSASAISAELKRRIQTLDAQVQSSGNPIKRQHVGVSSL